MLDTLANISEILAGLAIIYSVVKVLPFLEDLSSRKTQKPTLIPETILSQVGERLREKANYRGGELKSTGDLVNAIIEGGLSSGAAIIHIRHATRQLLRVSYGIDGQLVHILEFPAAHYLQVRNTILGEDDGTHTRNSQEARIMFDSQDDSWQDILKGHAISLRVHFSDTSEGEAIHLVVSSSMAARIGLNSLGVRGLEHEVLDRFTANLSDTNRGASRGLVLFAGQAQQGKTTTLYNKVVALADEGIEIASIEDPIEIDVPGFTQMDIQDVPGYRFSDRIRHGVAYSDLDALMIGELTTREIALAALGFATNSGMVFASIAAENATRGFENFTDLVGGSPISVPVLVVAQRLFRLLCTHCRVECELKPDDLAFLQSVAGFEHLSQANWYQAQGCSKCLDGYRGRSAAFEVYEYNGIEGAIPRSILENLVALTAKGRLDFAELRQVLHLMVLSPPQGITSEPHNGTTGEA